MLRIFNIGGSPNAEAPLTPQSDEAALLDSLSDAVLTTDATDHVTYANRAATELFGRDRDKIVGENLLNLFSRESRDTIRFAQSAARDGLPQRYDAGLASEEITVSISATPLARDPTSPGSVLTLRDVSEERRAHQELARSESRYRHLFEDASDAIMTFDSLGRFTSVNDAGERISGYTREELTGRFFGPLLPLTELPRAVLEFRKALSGQPGQFESVVVR